MKSLFDLCATTLTKSANQNEETYGSSLVELQGFLSSLKGRAEEVRLFVAGSINYGHQATSILIMNNLIRLGIRLVRIVYQRRQHPSDTTQTPTKLINLIPGLTEQDITQGSFQFQDLKTGETVTILFSRYENFNPGGVVTLGVSGGFDNTSNISRILKVQTLIVLQPFRYEKRGAKNILYFNPDLFTSNNAISLPTEFLEKGFYIEPPVEPTPYLDTPLLDKLEEWKRTTVKSIKSSLSSGKIEMCPIYFSQGRTSSQPTTVLFNLLTGFFAAKDSESKKPIVLTVMSGFNKDVYTVLSLMMSGKDKWWSNNPTGASANSIKMVQQWSPFLSEETYAYVQGKGYFDRFENVFIVTSNIELKQLQPVLVDEKGGFLPFDTVINGVDEGDVVIVDLGRVPKPVFEYIYSIGTLPGIFEGEATASLMLNLGKPYFNLESNDKDVKAQDHDLYPYPVIPTEELSPSQLAAYCSNFAFNFSDDVWKLNISTQGYVRTPDNVIAEFIDLAYINVKEQLLSNLSIYFRSLKTFFHDEKEDKLLKALFFALSEMKDRNISLT